VAAGEAAASDARRLKFSGAAIMANTHSHASSAWRACRAKWADAVISNRIPIATFQFMVPRLDTGK
jgi:hypothetical protein